MVIGLLHRSQPSTDECRPHGPVVAARRQHAPVARIPALADERRAGAPVHVMRAAVSSRKRGHPRDDLGASLVGVEQCREGRALDVLANEPVATNLVVAALAPAALKLDSFAR